MQVHLRAATLVWALAAVPSSVFAAQPCSQPDLHPFISKVKAVQSQLLAYKISDGMGEEDPPPLQSQIRAFKDAFAELGDAAVKCTPADVDAKRLEGTLARLLDANKPVVQEVYDSKKPEPDDHIYGDDVDVKVTRASNQHGLLLLDFRFDIQCGFDSLLLGYEFDSGIWKQVLRWQSGDYDEIKDAFGDFFDYVVLPRGAAGSWQIAVAHGHPWCSSNMSGFDVDLLQPNSGTGIQKDADVIQNKIYCRGNEDHRMKAVNGGFELRTCGYSIGMNVIMRPAIYRFEVHGDQLVREQPIANNGRDFVDEWLQLPWSDASRWSAAENRDQLEAIQKVAMADHDCSSDDACDLMNYGPVRSCTDSKSHFQVELDEEWTGPKAGAHRNVTRYFQIEQRKNSFTMLSASTKPDPHCTGHDIMPAQ